MSDIVINELFLLVFISISAFGFFLGGMLANLRWIGESYGGIRKECRGKLYWVIEDGDLDKLRHVMDSFERKDMGDA